DFATTILWRDFATLFDFGGLFRHLLVLDHLTKPVRIIMLAKMMQPGIVIHACRYLHKQDQVLRPQVELSLRSLEIEAPLWREFALGVFADMTPMLDRAGRQPDTLAFLRVRPPEQYFIRSWFVRLDRTCFLPKSLVERLDSSRRILANGNQ